MLRQFRRVVAGGVLTGLAILSLRVLRAGRLRSLDPSREDERFRLHADNARDLVYRFRFHPTPGFEYISPSSTAVTGYSPEEHYADPDLGLKRVHPEDRHLLESSMRSPEEPLVLRWYRKDGGLIWTEQRNKPIYDEAENVIAMEGIARDITERKRAEEVLVEAARARAAFLAEVSHELRTPLTVIRSNAEVGLELDRDCEHEEVLREIVRESSTMSRMVEDLLFLTRTESAAPPFRMEPVEAQVLLAGLARRNSAKPSGPPAPKGSCASTSVIEVQAYRKPNSHTSSSGFYRLAEVEESGSGLGLSIAQTIVEAHGGRIEAESQPGEETHMSFVLPLLQEGSKLR